MGGFEISDATLPTDWIGNLIAAQDGGSGLLLGPDFLAKSAKADSVDQFWKRVNSTSSA